jgi:hypothetical protein
MVQKSKTSPHVIATFWNKSNINKAIAVAAALVVIGAGLTIVMLRASGFFAATEPEQGTLTANAKQITDTNASGGKAIQFTAPVSGGGGGGGGSGACTVATANVPDGPDNNGGCWPGPSNTGPNASQASMAYYAGNCTITTPNTVIDSKVFACATLNIETTGVIIKNSYILSGVIGSDSASFTIEDSIINNALPYDACAAGSSCAAGLYACGDPNNATTDCGVGYKNFTIKRTEIYNSNRAAYCEKACTIEDSYFHGTNLWPSKTNLAHASSVRNEQNLTLHHNSLGCDYQGPFPNDEIGCSADMSGYPDFAPIKNATIDRNLFLANNIGTGFCVYGGGTSGKPFSNDATNATYMKFTNNVFQRGANGKCGTYGAVTDYKVGRTGNEWTNNKFDNGTDVAPQ